MKTLSRLILALSFASIAGAQNYSSDMLSFNPLGYWQLAANTNDTSGHATTLNNTGINFSTNEAPPIGSGSAVFGKVVTPTGDANQVLTLAVTANSNYSFTTTSKFSAAFWMKTVMQSDGSSFILGKGDPVGGSGWGLFLDNGDFLATQGGGRVMFGFFASMAPVLAIESNFEVNDGYWHFIVATSDGTGVIGGLHLYIDGQVAGTTSVASTGTGTVTNSVPFTIGNLPDGSDPFEGNIAGAAVFNTTLTAQQIAQLTEDAGSTKAILSQFAFGGGWYSAVYFTNTGSGTVSFPVTFTADNGTPLIIPSLSGNTTTATLAPGASTIIEGISAGALQEGYVIANLPALVTGYGLFRQSVPGIPDQEAVVPLAGAGSSNVSLVYDETGGIMTAAAIANSSANPINVTVTVTDNNGNVLGTVPLPTLQPFNKTEATVNTYVPLITGTRGIVKFSSATGGLNVIGLRFRNSAFTSIPGLNNRQLATFIGVQ